jgi:proline dehydrogenase
MGLSRNILLWGSKNNWLKTNVPSYSFVKRAVKRFMPGETVDDAIEASRKFQSKNIGNVFTRLGENITNLDEAAEVTEHYLSVLDLITEHKLNIEVSLKLTQLGFDLSFEQTLNNFKNILKKANIVDSLVWIDMEDSTYVDKTIEFYKEAKKEFENVGLCLQAYLYRTEKDLDDLLTINPNIRLVKGAYNEPKNVAYENKTSVDKNYFKLSQKLLEAVNNSNIRAAFATHDENLIAKIYETAGELGIRGEKIEFQMLYGIKTNTQFILAGKGAKVMVLISYGEAWFSWYMRRLAERPANVLFVLKNLFTK